MTMANSTVASPMRSSASLRKTNKPLMEKRRRARINDSLTQLKSLVIAGTKKDSSQFNKLEKADILELTVKHLRNLQNHQQLQQQQITSDVTGAPKYRDGYAQCANEVIRYLDQAKDFSGETKGRVISHIASCLQLNTNKSNLAKIMQAQTGVLSAHPTQATPSVNTNTASTHVATLNNAPADSLFAGQNVSLSSNRQIIHIVGAPFQTSPVSCKSQNVTILPSQPTAQMNITNGLAATHSTVSSIQAQQPQTPHYAQPLHIQIPPAFSPVLVPVTKLPTNNNIPRHFVKREPQQQSMDTASTTSQKLPSYPTQSDYHQQSLHQTENMYPRTPEPVHQSQTCQLIPTDRLESEQQPKQRSQQDTPITHIHKIHGFYSSAEDCVPPRARSYSTASSSSSSCSPDNDLPSPVTFTQSPTYKLETRLPTDKPIKPRHFMDKNNNSNRFCNRFNSTSSTISPTSSDISDQENINNNIIHQSSNMSFSRNAVECPQPFASVTLNGRKSTLEPSSFKYMSMMMEDDRQFTRNQGHRSRSTSPASSVGEERLWRPW